MAYMKDYGHEIRRRREALGLTQKDVGKYVGVSHAAVGNWELNKNQINGINLVKLADILKCAPRDLVDLGALTHEERIDLEIALITQGYKESSQELREAAMRMLVKQDRALHPG